MPLIKLATAARRARMGSVTAISRALRAAGVPLTALSPGVLAVEEEDLNRFLRTQQDQAAAELPPARPKRSGTYHPPEASGPKPKPRKRRS